MINCLKQSTVAVIMKDGILVSIGTNEIHNNQLTECPRAGMKSGRGYELCKNVCKQGHHAEVDACLKAGEEAKGATLYLIGHTYCCDDCKRVMGEHGIIDSVITYSRGS
jgi:deoxycytidylate deaminase